MFYVHRTANEQQNSGVTLVRGAQSADVTQCHGFFCNELRVVKSDCKWLQVIAECHLQLMTVCSRARSILRCCSRLMSDVSGLSSLDIMSTLKLKTNKQRLQSNISALAGRIWGDGLEHTAWWLWRTRLWSVLDWGQLWLSPTGS